MRRNIIILLALSCLVVLCSSWGFYAHKRINQMAVFTLPPQMIRFYKSNIEYLREHSVDPDKRRYTDPDEGGRHFLDTERYGASPFDSIPQKWSEAVAKFSEDTLALYGTVPWQIERSYYRLVRAFQKQDSAAILRHSAHLGHYIADAHVPLHVTWNYNGQLTNQVGIHAFWESRLPELFAERYNFYTGRARYIENPLKAAWGIVKKTYQYKDTVFAIEAALSSRYPPDKKYSYTERNGRIIKQHSEDYARAYHDSLEGMVEKQMRSSIFIIGCFWYSAWVDAGQPDLNKLRKISAETTAEQKIAPRHKKILGRSDI